MFLQQEEGSRLESQESMMPDVLKPGQDLHVQVCPSVPSCLPIALCAALSPSAMHSLPMPGILWILSQLHASMLPVHPSFTAGQASWPGSGKRVCYSHACCSQQN